MRSQRTEGKFGGRGNVKVEAKSLQFFFNENFHLNEFRCAGESDRERGNAKDCTEHSAEISHVFAI